MYMTRLFDDTGRLKSQMVFAILDNAYAALDALRELEEGCAGWTFDVLV